MDKDFKYNYERYYDPTVYMALNNVQKGEKMEQIKAGELWEYSSPKGDISQGLIIAVNGDVVTFLKLLDTKNNKHDIEVNCRGIKYAGSSMIVYGFVQYFDSYIRTLEDTVFLEIKDRVAKSLGLDVKVVEKVIEKESPGTATPDIEYNMELEKTKAQLEVYKGLYENLMQQMIGR